MSEAGKLEGSEQQPPVVGGSAAPSRSASGASRSSTEWTSTS